MIICRINFILIVGFITKDALGGGLGSLGLDGQLDQEPEPAFATRGKTFKVVTDDTVVLPCEINNLGTYVLAWKRGIAVLSAGSTKVSPDERYRLVDGYNLEIRGVKPKDAGEYICQIGMLSPKEVRHVLQILVPPTIRKVSGDGSVVMKKGDTIVLSCEAEGNPQPNITWTKKNDVLPTGKTMDGSTITIKEITRHQAGVYQCTAHNNVGSPVTREITLHVQFPPEIQVEKSWIHTGEGNEANLVCIVHAVPHAEVVWFRDTLRLDTTERRSTEVRGSRHTLIIRRVQQSDFGNYSCLADNGIGKTKQHVELSGRPHQALFKSHNYGRSKDSYNISWAVESYTPIEEYRLYYRRFFHPTPTTPPFSHNQPNYHHVRRPYRREDNEISSEAGASPVSSRLRVEGWHEISLPAVPSEQYKQAMWYVIKGLEPSTQYEATVNAKNRFGWSALSDKFVFSTQNSGYGLTENGEFSDPVMRDLGVKAYDSSSSLRVDLVLICALLFAIRWTT